jgi:hypothetical protein
VVIFRRLLHPSTRNTLAVVAFAPASSAAKVDGPGLGSALTAPLQAPPSKVVSGSRIFRGVVRRCSFSACVERRSIAPKYPSKCTTPSAGHSFAWRS